MAAKEAVKQEKGVKADLFFRCKQCGTVMTDADFAFNRETGEEACICGHCKVGRGTLNAHKEEQKVKSRARHGSFYAKNIFRYFVPYFLYGEILYLSLTGVKDKTIFIFFGLLRRISQLAGWIGLGVDIALMILGLAAIIYSAKVFYDGDGFTGYEQAREQYTLTTYSESMLTGKIRGRSQDVTVYNDNVYLNIMIFIWNFIKVLFLTVFGVFIFIVVAIKHTKATKVPKSKKKSEKERLADELCSRFERTLSANNAYYTLFSKYTDEEWKRLSEDYQYMPEDERMSLLSTRYTMRANGEMYFMIRDDIPLWHEFEGKGRFKVKKVYLLARPHGEKPEIKFFATGDYNLFIPYHEELFDQKIQDYCKGFSYNRIPHNEEELTSFTDKQIVDVD